MKPQVNTSNLRTTIIQALNRSWFFEPDAIKVTADGGKVRLTGTVHSWNDRQVAGATAWAAPGAIAVENDITIM